MLPTKSRVDGNSWAKPSFVAFVENLLGDLPVGMSMRKSRELETNGVQCDVGCGEAGRGRGRLSVEGIALRCSEG